MKIENPVVRAGSVTPAYVTQPSLLFEQELNITLLDTTVFTALFTQDLTDETGFGPLYQGTYTINRELVFIGGAADAEIVLETGQVTGFTTSFNHHDKFTVPAGQTVYHYQQQVLKQAEAGVYDVSVRYTCNQSDVTFVGKDDAVDDWSTSLITKVASNT